MLGCDVDGLSEDELIALALEASMDDAAGNAVKEAEKRAGSDRHIALTLEASRLEAVQQKEARRLSEDQELQAALALSASCDQPSERLVDDDDSIQRALDESEKQKEAELARVKERNRTEDEGELFQAALRASRVDLGPRGISQAAKIFATGDATLGQANVVASTGSHGGAGSKFSRNSSSACLKDKEVGDAPKLRPASSTTALPRQGGSTRMGSPATSSKLAGNGAERSVALQGAGRSMTKGLNVSHGTRGSGFKGANGVSEGRG